MYPQKKVFPKLKPHHFLTMHAACIQESEFLAHYFIIPIMTENLYWLCSYTVNHKAKQMKPSPVLIASTICYCEWHTQGSALGLYLKSMICGTYICVNECTQIDSSADVSCNYFTEWFIYAWSMGENSK